MRERIETALAAAKKSHLIEALEALAGVPGERIEAAAFAARRGNVEETVEHLSAALAEPAATPEPPVATRQFFGKTQ